MRKGAIPLAFVGMVAAASCETTVDPVTSASADVESLIGSVCDIVFRCCERGEVNYLLGPYVDEADCTSRLVQANTISGTSLELSTFAGPSLSLPNIAAFERAVLEGRIGVDQSAMDACVAYLNGLECPAPLDEEVPETCVPPKPPLGSTPCDPANLFIGLVPLSGACTSSLLSMECAVGLACARDGDLGVTGECVPVGDIGDPCFTSIECGIHVNEGELLYGQNRRERLYCSQADGTCQRLRREGETCLYADREDPFPDPSTALIRCSPELSCDPVTDICVAACQRGAACGGDFQCDELQELVCVAGRCDKPRGEGADCLFDADCAEPFRCAPDPNDPAASLCAVRLPNGEDCLSHASCESGFCEPVTDRCQAQVAAGGLCPSDLNAQCDKGVCTNEFISCIDDSECPGSNSCDLQQGQCASYCVALKPEGATCFTDDECESNTCAAGFCRVLPLDDGVACDSDFQCDSDFCSLDPMRVCKSLPLDLAEPCSDSYQCESEVCFQDPATFEATCVNGLDEGEACGDIDQAPCNPKELYCDFEVDPAVCTPLRRTGEDCEDSVQCRGDCEIAFNRRMCFPPFDPAAPMCDGETPAETSNE